MKKFETLAPSALLTTALLAVSGAAIAQDDVIVVRGQNIPDEKKATSEISSVLDGEDFIRAGDSDIADALRRVTGLSIEGGKFVIVRGLNSRYSSATLNGTQLPSPEPLKRTAPLDLFPTSVLDGSLVQKTYSPQYSAEFGGGVVELRTKRIPDEDFLEIGVSFSANTETSIASGLFYDGSDTDVFGFDDGLRDLPAEVSAFLAANPNVRDLDVTARTSFDQFDTLLISRDNVPLNGGGSVAFGKIFDTDGDIEVGTTFYIGYDNTWQTRHGERIRPETFDGQQYVNLGEDTEEYTSTTQDITLSALSSTGFEWGFANELALTALIVRKSSKEAQIGTGVADQENDLFKNEKTSFIEREIWQVQTAGEHTLFSGGAFNGGRGLDLDWRIAYGEGTREAPYERQTRFEIQPGQSDFVFRNNSSLNFINFGFIEDKNFNVATDFVLPLEYGDGRALDIIFGGGYTVTNREAERRDFVFSGAYPQEILGSRADLIFSDEILSLTGPRVTLQSTRSQPDNFEGSMQVGAAYIGADIELGDYLRAAVGGRFEDSKQKTRTFATIDPQNNAFTQYPTLQEEFLLPSVTLTWIPSFTQTSELFGETDIQLRLGYSETITRPQFRELTAVRFEDPDVDIVYSGNPFLENTRIKNYDARLEMYFARGEFATIGLFFKKFDKPIEDFFSTQGEASVQSFGNAPSAELWGAELELEKNFDLAEIIESEWAFGKDLVFKTNYTYSDSRIQVEDTDVLIRALNTPAGVDDDVVPANAFIRDGSPITGQSDHLFNLQLGVADNNTGTTATALVNYASERILYRNEGLQPAITENPPISLDFVVNQNVDLFGAEYSLGVKFQNILNDRYEALQETGRNDVAEVPFESYDLGRTVSVSLKRTF